MRILKSATKESFVEECWACAGCRVVKGEFSYFFLCFRGLGVCVRVLEVFEQFRVSEFTVYGFMVLV